MGRCPWVIKLKATQTTQVACLGHLLKLLRTVNEWILTCYEPLILEGCLDIPELSEGKWGNISLMYSFFGNEAGPVIGQRSLVQNHIQTILTRNQYHL